MADEKAMGWRVGEPTTLERAMAKMDYRSFSRREIQTLQHEVERLRNETEDGVDTRRERELEAGVAAFRAMVVRAPVMLEAEDWERWYRRLMTVMDRTGHMVTAEAHERAQPLLPGTDGGDDG